MTGLLFCIAYYSIGALIFEALKGHTKPSSLHNMREVMVLLWPLFIILVVVYVVNDLVEYVLQWIRQ